MSGCEVRKAQLAGLFNVRRQEFRSLCDSLSVSTSNRFARIARYGPASTYALVRVADPAPRSGQPDAAILDETAENRDRVAFVNPEGGGPAVVLAPDLDRLPWGRLQDLGAIIGMELCERWGAQGARVAQPFGAGWPEKAVPLILGLLGAPQLNVIEIEAGGRRRGEEALELAASEESGPVEVWFETLGSSDEFELLALTHAPQDTTQIAAAAPSSGWLVGRDVDYDWLECRKPGRVLDGQLEEQRIEIGENFAWFIDARTSEPIGFCIREFSEVDLDDPQYEAIWRPPLLDVPMLDLHGASAGQVAQAARVGYGERSTPNRELFDLAVEADGEEALALWEECLDTGDEMARYALGYTLLELGRYREAFEALRHYVRIDETNAWAWDYLGRACEALRDWEGAEYAYRKAVELEEHGSFESQAADNLAALLARRADATSGTA